MSWKIAKAKKITIDGNPESLPLEGSITLVPQKDTLLTFRFSIRKKKIIVKKRKIKVTVPEIIRFHVPDSASDEEQIRISWRTENAQYVTISGIADTLRPSGSTNLQLDSSAVFSLVAHGKYLKDSSENLEIFIHQIEELDAKESSLYRGDSIKISWKSKLSEGVYLDNSDSLLPPQGEHIFYPRENRKFHLLVKRRYGKIDTLGSFFVKVLDPRIKSFRGTNTVLEGETAKLSWSVLGGDNISIDGVANRLGRQGSVFVKPDKDSKYTLRVRDGEKDITSEFEINVHPFRKYVNAKRDFDELGSGEEITLDIISADRSSYPDSVVLKVIAVDTSGNYISGLASDEIANKYFKNLRETVGTKTSSREFKIREVIEMASAPYDISIVMDYSGSMTGITQFSEQAMKTLIKMNYPEDRIAITKFDQNIATTASLTSGKEQLLESVDALGLSYFGGSTALYAAAHEGLKKLDSTNFHKVLLLFTDGYENASLQYFGTHAFTANQLARLVRKGDAQLFVVSYGLGTNAELLLELSQVCDGMYYPIQDPKMINKVFEELPHILHQYYEVVYKPQKNGGHHKLRLGYHSGIDFDQTRYQFYVGEDFDLSQYEISKDNYWYREVNGKKPVSSPQVVANFPFNDDFLLDEYLQNLEKYCLYLENFPDAELDILAHADHIGTNEQCLILTNRRCNRVKDYFIRQGINEKRLHIRSFGKSEPVWPNETTEWQAAENRRVELIIFE